MADLVSRLDPPTNLHENINNMSSLKYTTIKYSAIRTALRAWQFFRPRCRIGVGDRTLVIPTTSREAVELAQDWRPDWKTTLIHRILARRPGKLLDIGANIGQTLLDYCASPHRSGYIGFEPNPHCLPLILEIIAVNELDDCVVVPAGLSAENSIVKLYFKNVFVTDSGASMLQGLRPNKKCQSLFVPCLRFDDIFRALEIEAIGLIKIDVEGAELSVLGGMTGTLQRFRPWVICEVLLRDANADHDAYLARISELMEAVNQAGYVAMRIEKSPDGMAVEGFAWIQAFPDLIWSYEQAEQCDYLLVPGTDASQVQSGLLCRPMPVQV